MIKPPESPIQQLAGVEQLKAQVQQQQMGEIQLEEARSNQTSEQTLMESFSRNGGDFNKTYADAANSGKVTPSMLSKFRAESIAAQTQAAILSEKQLENLAKTHDLAANALESVKQLPEDQRQVGIQRQLASLAQQGVDISKIVPALQGLPDYSDKSLNSVEMGLKGEQWVIANEKAQREARQAPSDAEAEAQRQATLTETINKGNLTSAETSLALKRKEQLGEITPEDRFKEEQANWRAMIQRQATFAQGLQKNGLEQIDKMFADPQHGYIQFISQAQSTKNTIMQSKNGNELASNLEPLMIALGVTSFAGVHRINQTEVNAAGPHAGSLYRRLNSIIDKAGSGSVPEDTLKEATAIVDGLIDAKHSATVNGANMVVANAGLDPKKTMVMDRSGTMTTLEKAQEGNQRVIEPAKGAAPAGATHIVPGPDGKNHYTNATGTVDLGVAPD